VDPSDSFGRAVKAGVLLLALASCGGDPLDRLAEGGRGRVEAALAGGLVRLDDGAVVRLAGVDVPGRGESGWTEARAALAGVAMGRTVSLLHGGVRSDGFGRAIAHLRTTTERRWVQGALLDAGLARVRTAPGDRALAREMLEREARARIARRGLWASEVWRVRLPDEVGHGFTLVEGRLAMVAPEGSEVGLAFAQGGLRLEVSPRTAKDLASAGLAPDVLGGRVVRVRGTVRSGALGPTLTIDHPEQIEVLEPG
jgi:endonuclease YncB( thermonuclease family)